MSIYKIIRTRLRSWYLDIVGSFSKPSPCVHILNGHMLTRLTPQLEDQSQFKVLLEELHRECDFINFDDAVDMIVNHKVVDKPLVAFSFDDGFTDCYDYLIPELEKYGIHVACFINPGFADAEESKDEDYIHRFTNVFMSNDGKKPMSWKQIVDLHNRGHIIGAHTIDHYMVNQGSQAELYHQIVDCKKMIEFRLGYECKYFAWPYGKLAQANENAVSIACNTYSYVFSQSDYRHYFSFKSRVINRRHFEPFWPLNHVKYFLSCKRS